ncbi:hypothetical protein N7471_004326 [Penicillium samsonianum]|uniref:uncharacterized protein n=1 Tax=Penicillium samsonianum TaxID=1882272 RepID=UPI0025498297|nr:uncharacterized protein N7471_004326 [Penicillium samsonianum]KAJ6137840.1 hypothetical protein N7471_004326 [Penicillium samsonianum]
MHGSASAKRLLQMSCRMAEYGANEDDPSNHLALHIYKEVTRYPTFPSGNETKASRNNPERSCSEQ